MGPPSKVLLSLADAPAEALAFIERLLQEPVVDPREPPRLEELKPQLREGKKPGWLWLGPGDEAIALLFDLGAPIGHRVRVLLGPGYRTRSACSGLLELLERAAAPLVALRFLGPGLDLPTAVEVLEPAGFRYLLRVDLERSLEDEVPEGAPEPGLVLREILPQDADRLAVLLDRAYSTDPYDRVMFQEKIDAVEDARASVTDLLAGRYGPWIAPASLVAERGGRFEATVFCVLNDGALVAELLVDPSCRRRGLGRLLLHAAMRRLRAAGHPRVRLVYTGPNRPARELYASLGFAPPDPPEIGGEWVHVGRLGHPEIEQELLTASVPRPGGSPARRAAP
ncbi:MAG: GNAT family N-acetyltransferase [Thermoplasmata archaeon]|nr:GNAT family N-acetyltransferase [Thermoplasmata archaeon]